MVYPRKFKYSSIVCALLPIPLATPAFSNDDMLMKLYEEEEFVMIATATNKPLHLAPSVASVITAKDIANLGATSLDEILETVPGLHVSRSFNRLNSIYSIRGIHTQQNAQVLLLVNGVAFNDIVTGSRPPSFYLPVANISRIEIIRGPGSAVYGADAFAGVINVITKGSKEMAGVAAGGRTGSFDTHDVWLQYGGGYDGLNVSFSTEYSVTNGDDERLVRSDFQTSLDNTFGTNASLAPGALETRREILNTSLEMSNDEWALWLNSWNLNDGGTGPGGAQALDPVGRQDADQYVAKLSYSNDRISENWGIEGRLSYRVLDQKARFTLLPGGTAVPICPDGNLPTSTGCTSGVPSLVAFPDGLLGNPGGSLKESSFELAAAYTGFSGHNIRVAIGAEHDNESVNESKNFGPGVIDGTVTPIDSTYLKNVTGTDDVFMQDKSRTLYYLTTQDEWKLAPDWELTAGIRFDHYSDFGETFNPRLALVWATHYNLTSKLLYGRAFRAPSFTELYFKNNPSVIGNPSLHPETIDMIELVFDYRPNFDVHTVFNIFAYEIDDLIEFESGLASNSRNQKGHGFEMEADWQPSNTLRVNGNLSWQRSEDKSTGEPVPDAPRYQVYLNSMWKMQPSLSLSAQANWVAGRKRAPQDVRPEIDDITTVDCSLRWKNISESLELAAAVRNLFDEEVYEPSDGAISDDYPMSGRNLYIEARYRFDGKRYSK